MINFLNMNKKMSNIHLKKCDTSKIFDRFYAVVNFCIGHDPRRLKSVIDSMRCGNRHSFVLAARHFEPRMDRENAQA
jgi:hypothetical protein